MLKSYKFIFLNMILFIGVFISVTSNSANRLVPYLRRVKIICIWILYKFIHLGRIFNMAIYHINIYQISCISKSNTQNKYQYVHVRFSPPNFINLLFALLKYSDQNLSNCVIINWSSAGLCNLHNLIKLFSILGFKMN